MARAFLKRVRLAGSLAWLAVTNRYEAAIQKWGERSWIASSVQDARFDADASTRIELVRRSRYWEQNNAFVNRLVDLFEQYTVGSNGLRLVPNSTDEGWNASASDWWQNWCLEPDKSSLLPMAVIQSIIARAWFVDGEIFIYKTKQGNKPAIQLIEAHRVCTPRAERKREGIDIVDGIQIDSGGKPIGYFVRDANGLNPYQTPGTTYRPQYGGSTENYVLIPADKIIHVFEPCRAGMYRGLPMLYPVMNDLHDLDDLQMLENRAAKDAAEITNVITNASGEADPKTMRRMQMQIQSQDQNGNPVNKKDDQYYQVSLGAKTVMLRRGDDIKQFQTNRPSVTTREYWDYLVAKVCAGVGISRLLVLPYSMQGTVTRADLDVANAFFRARSAVIGASMRQLYLWAISFAVKFDKQLDGTPSDASWQRVIVRPPRAVNVDVGRNSSAILAELDAGTRNFQGIYADDGLDWREELTQKAEERAFIHGLVAKMKTEHGIELDPNEIASVAMPGQQNEPSPDKEKGSTSPATTATP